MKRRQKVGRALASSLVVPWLGGCPEQEPLEPCERPADPIVELADRDDGRDVFPDGNGGRLEVFDAPQGGVFAELDVTVTNLALSTLLYLRVTVDDPATGEQLAFARYFGNSVPLRCTEDDVLEMSRMPLGFAQLYDVEDLDGRLVTLTGSLETETDEFPTTYEVVLQGVQY